VARDAYSKAGPRFDAETAEVVAWLRDVAAKPGDPATARP
jgi:hypothetical protein